MALTACAEESMEMAYFPGQEKKVQDKVWPAPPDVPRYRYAGLLTGEQNFVPDKQNVSSQGEKFFRWLVGLGQGRVETRQLERPQGGMVGQDGRIYITDVGKQAVFVFDVQKNNLLIWDRTDANDKFLSPIGITTGSQGEILVADSQLARIIRLDNDGNPLGSFGKDILQRPTGIASDPESGYIYVSDTTAHDIKIFDKDGDLIDSFGQRGTSKGEFNGPTHLTFADRKLYVSDTLNARIQILTTDGEALSTVGQRGLYIGNLTRPKGVTVDDDGNIYIVESYYDHLLVFNKEGELLLPIGGSGDAVGDFFLPSGVWSDQQNRIYTADMFNSRVVIMQYLGN
jgi:DNA-binding beta-propeller fold protein YncE